MSEAVITCVDDLRVLHQRRVPRMFFDYAESGSWTETTLRRNIEAFAKVKLRQRVAKDISQRSIAASMLGAQWSMPVALAPTGLAGMQRADGEILAAQAAEEFGVPFLGALPFDPGFVRGGDDGVHRIVSEPDGASAKAFASVVAAIQAQLSDGADGGLEIV